MRKPADNLQKLVSVIEAQSVDLRKLTEIADILASAIKEEQKYKKELTEKLTEQDAKIQELSNSKSLDHKKFQDLSIVKAELAFDLETSRASSATVRRALIDCIIDLHHSLRVRALEQYRATGRELGFIPDVNKSDWNALGDSKDAIN